MCSYTPMPIPTEDRHPTIQDLATWFDYEHLPAHLQEISEEFHSLAEVMLAELPDSPQFALGLQHLLEAKDCFVRAAQQQHYRMAVQMADVAQEQRKAAIVDQTARVQRAAPENPTGVATSGEGNTSMDPAYLEALSREPKGSA